FRPTKADYDLFLGRLHSVKGYRWALTGAKRSGRRLLVGGGWRPSFRRNIRYVGEVHGTKKAELLAGARCLWMPALWEEPFGLTLIEALFSGTPVLATRRGGRPPEGRLPQGDGQQLLQTVTPRVLPQRPLSRGDGELAPQRVVGEQGAGAIHELGHAPIQHDLAIRREVARDVQFRIRQLRRAHGRELEHPHVGAGSVAHRVAAVPELLVDVHPHGRARN